MMASIWRRFMRVKIASGSACPARSPWTSLHVAVHFVQTLRKLLLFISQASEAGQGRAGY